MAEEVLDIFGQFLSYTWWLWLFLILWPLFRLTWRFWREELYLHSDECKAVLLEIRMPREITKSAQAMEQVLFGIHQMKNAPGNFEEWWIDGEVPKWWSFEMVSFGGDIHFYVRVPFYRQKPLVESSFYAFYPDIELIEVEDYVNRLPASVQEMNSQGYNMWGSEMIFAKPDAYPIRTYHDFESPDEDKQYDPISHFVELLAKVKPEEIVCIQILAEPVANEHWVHESEPLVEQLRVREQEGGGHGHGGGGFGGPMEFPGGPLPATAHKEEKQKGFSFVMRTPGETDVLKAVETNLSKPVFETVIRFMYLSPQPLFWDSFPRRGLRGAFNQYAASDLNSFTQNDKITTLQKIWDKPYVFPKRRSALRKARLLYNYRHRAMPPENFMGKIITSRLLNWNFGTKKIHMTTQTLATIFHPPTSGVLIGPHVQRVPSRKAGPPAGLAIFSNEADLERYQ